MSNIINIEKAKERLRCPKCGEKLLYWELTCPICGTCIRIPENDHINYTEKSEFGAPVYRAE